MGFLLPPEFSTNVTRTAWIYASEIPTNRLRAYNVALASLTHWLHNLAVSKTTPIMLFSTPFGAYFIFGSFNITMAIVAFWLPETKGVSAYLCMPQECHVLIKPIEGFFGANGRSFWRC